jgi:hypothetical protein
MAQTAVNWLIEQLKERGYAGQFPPHLLFDHAKQMEKEQIMEGFKAGNHSEMRGGKVIDAISEQYYNEAYGKD